MNIFFFIIFLLCFHSKINNCSSTSESDLSTQSDTHRSKISPKKTIIISNDSVILITKPNNPKKKIDEALSWQEFIKRDK